ncbi:MAG: sensor histidine kinase [Balneolaceae bacterium]
MNKSKTKQKNSKRCKIRLQLLLVLFAVFFGFFLFVLHEGIHLISATQSFTAANAQWTQTQKNAVNDLYLYARTHNEEDFQNFRKRIGQVYAIRNGIDEIRKKNPDPEFIRQGLSSLEIPDKLINSMISVKRYLGSVEQFTAAHSVWEECGVKINMIEAAANNLHNRYIQGELQEEELNQELGRIQKMDESLSAEAQNILIQLGESSNWLKNQVVGIISFAGFILVLFAGLIAFYWYKMTRQLQIALDEREVLIAEIHHRVKNNLAVVAGLLELEIDNVADHQFIQVLKRSTARIHSIALVHEKLYEYRNFSHINFKKYTEELVKYIDQTFEYKKGITVNKILNEVTMNINQAVPLAIIINEVLVNAYKHAFNSYTGNIELFLYNNDEMVTIIIRDDGVGLPEDFDIDQVQSLGLKLIKRLASQLKAHILFDAVNGSGTNFQISFRKAEIRGSSSAHVIPEAV